MRAQRSVNGAPHTACLCSAACRLAVIDADDIARAAAVATLAEFASLAAKAGTTPGRPGPSLAERRRLRTRAGHTPARHAAHGTPRDPGTIRHMLRALDSDTRWDVAALRRLLRSLLTVAALVGAPALRSGVSAQRSQLDPAASRPTPPTLARETLNLLRRVLPDRAPPRVRAVI